MKYKYALPIGTILAGGEHSYRIEDVLGQGGFGITYRVSARIMYGNIPVTTQFAVKEFFAKGISERAADGITQTYSQESAEDIEESLHDFIKEGKRLAQICKGNRNIVNVNEVFEANNTAYYVMEYLDGGNLRDIVVQKGKLAEVEMIDLILPIAHAVAYIHREKLLHLDIKPENIMIRKGTNGNPPEPILIDFGVALHFRNNGQLTSKHTSAYTSKGYSPQEQYAGITRFVPEADIYALCATMYYMLVGHEPLSAFEMTPEYTQQTLPPNISETTRLSIIHGLRQQSTERTKNVNILIDELKGNDQNDTGKTRKKPVDPIPPPPPFPLRKYLVCLALLLLVGYATYSLFNSRGISKKEYVKEQADSIVDQNTDTMIETKEDQDKQDIQQNPKPQNPPQSTVGSGNENREEMQQSTDVEQLPQKETVPSVSAAEMARRYMNKFKSGERISENLSKAFEYAKKADETTKNEIIKELRDAGYRPAIMYKNNTDYEQEL